jgi:hypothetical protein
MLYLSEKTKKFSFKDIAVVVFNKHVGNIFEGIFKKKILKIFRNKFIVQRWRDNWIHCRDWSIGISCGTSTS